MTPVIIDIILAAVLLITAILGWYRGLFRAAAGFVIIIISLVGAGIFAQTYSEAAAQRLTPFIEEHVSNRIEKATQEQQGALVEGTLSEVPEQLAKLLESIGLDEETIRSLAASLQGAALENNAALVNAATEKLTASVLYGILFLLSFLFLWVALHLVAHLIDLILKLPLLHGANAFGGMLVGLAEGVLLIWLALWLAPRLGYFISADFAAQTYILRYLLAYSPMSLLPFL